MNNMPLKIIIIDDNPDIHRDFIKILKISKDANSLTDLDETLFGEPSIKNDKNGLPAFDIDTASQGEEGIQKIKKALEEGHPYALAFIDVRMPPGIDGIQTIKKIWEFEHEIQVVICTAYSDYSWEETVKTLGVNDNLLILKKPFDVTSVRQLASALTQKWLISKDTKKHTESLNQLVDERTNSLNQSLALLRATIESSSDGILVLNLQGNVIDYNKQFVVQFNIDANSLKKNKQTYLLNHMLEQMREPKKYMKLYHTNLKTPDSTSIHIIRFKNDRVFECYSKPHRIGADIVGRVWSFHEITEQVLLKDKLEYQATHDALTGLPNRSLLLDRMEQGIENAVRNKTKLAVLFLDLDRFKFVNDSLGHDFGDQLLCNISKKLQSLVRKMDTVARLGGDEFVLMLPFSGSNERIIVIVNKILQLFKNPFILSQHKIKITTSIGISIYPIDGTTVNTLINHADLAMYQAKLHGANQCAFYTEKLNETSEHQIQIEMGLQRALDNNEFFLFYQPQFDIKNQKLISLEALLRWNDPDKGLIMPKEFIPIAEQSGLIIPIGEWVIREACQQVIRWHQAGLPFVKVAVNVATKQLRHYNFPNTVKQILDEIHLEPQYLEIEITENVIVDNEVQKTVIKLKEIGCAIVLDDFGTGSSSLNSLKQLHIDRLKIDQSFVQNITKSRGDEAIIESIIAISHIMNFKVIAEGIETENQIDFLRKKHCDVIQGFLWSKPLPAEELENTIRSGKFN